MPRLPSELARLFRLSEPCSSVTNPAKALNYLSARNNERTKPGHRGNSSKKPHVSADNNSERALRLINNSIFVRRRGSKATVAVRICYSWLGYTDEVYAIESESFKNCIWSYIIEMAEGKTIEECEAKLKQECQNRLDESFAYYILLEEMKLRKSAENMTIQSHHRNPTTITKPDLPTNCLFALAAIGSSFAINVQFLRQVRDETLKSNCVGASIINAIVRIYYLFSPSIVNTMQLNEKFKQSVRKFIVQPVVLLLTNIFKNLENKSSILKRN